MDFFEYSNFDYHGWSRPEHVVVKDAKLRATIHTVGHVIIDNFLPDQLIKELRDQFERNHSIEVENGGFFVSIYSKNISYRRATHDHLLSKLISRFDEVFIDHKYTSLNYAVKYPGPAGDLYIHQDMGQIDEFKYSQLGVWIPLQDVSVENGTMGIIPRSHFTIPPHRSLYGGLPFSKIYDKVWEYIQPVQIKAGDLLLFDTRLLHNSFANSSDSPRISVVTSVVPSDARFCMTYRDNSFESDEYELRSLSDDFFLEFQDFTSAKMEKPGISTGKRMRIRDAFVHEDEFIAFCTRFGLSKNGLKRVVSDQPYNSIQEPRTVVSHTGSQSIIARFKKFFLTP